MSNREFQLIHREQTFCVLKKRLYDMDRFADDPRLLALPAYAVKSEVSSEDMVIFVEAISKRETTITLENIPGLRKLSVEFGYVGLDDRMSALERHDIPQASDLIEVKATNSRLEKLVADMSCQLVYMAEQVEEFRAELSKFQEMHSRFADLETAMERFVVGQDQQERSVKRLRSDICQLKSRHKALRQDMKKESDARKRQMLSLSETIGQPCQKCSAVIKTVNTLIAKERDAICQQVKQKCETMQKNMMEAVTTEKGKRINEIAALHNRIGKIRETRPRLQPKRGKPVGGLKRGVQQVAPLARKEKFPQELSSDPELYDCESYDMWD